MIGDENAVPSRFERAADVIPEIDHLRDADGGHIGEHGLEREAVAVDVSDRSKFHRPISVMDWPMTNVMRAAGEEVRFSCIYKSARKQIVKSALRINLASRL